ncbi:hypothetical protein ONA70_16550 [Micromonospora yasonensis]|uniref:hypothetical protein n=1 Tax=Micromonospora yasonensis TaxID=1128667 RepID=UPI0022305896|nr:hypothetical protein [Micromonospora yasonensis]MCW3841712.1 hypothetical protein [Micromonospora yasonensis]
MGAPEAARALDAPGPAGRPAALGPAGAVVAVRHRERQRDDVRAGAPRHLSLPRWASPADQPLLPHEPAGHASTRRT